MKIGIMQPYLFPYIGYYSLIFSTDKWVVFDNVQYIKKGWVNRNRVIKSNGGVKYIGIPIISSSRDTPINQILINNSNWKVEFINHLDYYKKVKAPRYNEVLDMINTSFNIETNNLSEILINCLKTSCDFLEIRFDFDVFSKLENTNIEINKPGDWAFEISKIYGATTYINPCGGVELFDRDQFKKQGIDLKFLKHNLPSYNQKANVFESGLSVIDVMMFNSNIEIHSMLNSFNLF
jgi:hypothetical protein